VPITEADKAKQTLRIVEALEDLDDVQAVYANFDMSAEPDGSGGRLMVAIGADAPGLRASKAPTAPTRAGAPTRCRTTAGRRGARLLPGRQHAGVHPQLNEYTAEIDAFHDVGAQVLALSPQDVPSHEAFADKQGGFGFPLLADTDKAVGEAYGILGPARLLPALGVRDRRRRQGGVLAPRHRRAHLPPHRGAGEGLVDHNHDERYLEQTQPVVLNETAGGWRTASSSNPVAFEILGPLAFLSGAASTPDDEQVAYSLPLTQPASVGGTSYRLASVEYCVRLINAANSKVDSAAIYSDSFTGATPLTAEVTDLTDRTTVGCFALTTSTGTARSYSLVLGVSLLGSATSGGLIVSGVRSTWVPSSGAATVVQEPVTDADPIGLLPSELLEQLAG
jgi:hypothetical protein